MIEQDLRSLDYKFFRNIGQRNSNNGSYQLVEILSLTGHNSLFDIQAIPPHRQIATRSIVWKTIGLMKS